MYTAAKTGPPDAARAPATGVSNICAIVAIIVQSILHVQGCAEHSGRPTSADFTY